MVGIAGRSKACNSCRRRRIKCDEQKPHCRRCVKARLECVYRDLPIIPFQTPASPLATSPNLNSSANPDAKNGFLIFRAEASPAPTLTAAPLVRPAITSPSGDGYGYSNGDSNSNDYRDASNYSNGLSDGHIDAETEASHSPESLPVAHSSPSTPSSRSLAATAPTFIPAFMSQTPASHDGLFLVYTQASLMNRLPLERDAPALLRPLMPLSENGCAWPLLSASYLSLATVYFGLEHRQPEVFRLGLARYGHVLSEVQAKVNSLGTREGWVRQGRSGELVRVDWHDRDEDGTKRLDLLRSVVMMSLLETMAGEGNEGWIAHCLGLEMMLFIFGPESFTSPLSLCWFSTVRPLVILASLARMRPSLMADTAWKTIPWRNDPSTRDETQHLFDVLADCTVLYSQLEQLETSSNRDADIRRLHAGAAELLVQLDRWRTDVWDTQNPDVWAPTPPPPDAPPAPPLVPGGLPAWTTLLSYRSPRHASILATSHATAILLLLLVSPVTHPQRATRLLDAAVAVCRSVDFLLRAAGRGAGSFRLLFPIRMAHEALVRCISGGSGEGTHGGLPPVVEWLHDILEKIATGQIGHWGVAGNLVRERGGR